jgi:tetratricopeptide (TPR) repeat protein
MIARGSRRPVVWLSVLLIGMSGALAVFVAVARSRPVRSLDGLQTLLAARRFDEAELQIGRYLRLYPDSLTANMLMAQVALERDGQKPRLALDHLARIVARDRATHALVMLNEGKAYSALGWNDRAEEAWKKALSLDRRVPEAGWALLSLYYVQGRRALAHQLAMALHVTEPDPRDRAQLLLELVRHDAEPLGPDSLVQNLEPIVRNRPGDLHTALALGLALVRNSRPDQGLSHLRQLVERFADNVDGWDALLLALDDAGNFDELASTLARVPTALAGDVRFERHKAAVAQARREWSQAADHYHRAWRADPSDLRVLYRLGRMLKAAGRLDQAEAFDRLVHAGHTAKNEILALYKEADAVKDLGVAPHPELCHRLADLRERMGRHDEALAWHRLVVRIQPADPTSLGSIERLQATVGGGMALRP